MMFGFSDLESLVVTLGVENGVTQHFEQSEVFNGRIKQRRLHVWF